MNRLGRRSAIFAEGGLLDGDGLQGHVLMAGAVAGGHALDGLDHVHALDDPAKDGIAQPCASLLRWLRKLLSATLMKNWAVAEWGSLVRAMATVPTSLARPLSASFWMGSRVGFCCMSAVRPPPWIMKPSMTRWKMVSSKKPSRTYWAKLAEVSGARSWSSSMRMVPREVLRVTMDCLV